MTAVDDELKPPGDRSLAEELIDDRALEDAEQDLLHHKDIVDELEQLVCATEVPANVALYGAWGSGKSSLANILGARLRHREVPVPFARFDAFKYADGPLRRLFISRVAAELGVTGDPRRSRRQEGAEAEVRQRPLHGGHEVDAEPPRHQLLEARRHVRPRRAVRPRRDCGAARDHRPR